VGRRRRSPLALLALALAPLPLVTLVTWNIVVGGAATVPCLFVAGRARARLGGRPGPSSGPGRSVGLVHVARVAAVVLWIASSLFVLSVNAGIFPEPPTVSALRHRDPPVIGLDRQPLLLEVSECFDKPTNNAADSLASVTVRSCSEPHQSEVYARVDLDTAFRTFPGREAVRSFVAQRCGDRFTTFIGIPEAESAFTLEYFFPSDDDTWAAGVHYGVCSALGRDGQPVIGTLKDVGR
jgi:hypothetical protein